MIVQTTKEINGVIFTYTYSDSGRLYTETDEPIDVGTKEEIVEDYKAALQILGVETEESV